MSYTDEAVKAKLSSLNESQDSIVTVAQWIMFHRRHAERTANIWLQRIRDSNPEKRLNLVYLANEVIQQTRAKRRDEFLIVFSPVMTEAIVLTYKGSPPHLQSKLQRVIQVWKERQIFDQQIQQSIESQISDIDKGRPQTHRKALGGSLSGPESSHVPIEFQPLVQAQHTLSRAHLSIKPALQATDKDYDSLTTGQPPTPPVYASRLSALGKALATAEAAVAESLKTREELIAGLEKLLEANRQELAAEEAQKVQVSQRRTEIDSKKLVVEDAIMRGLPVDDDALPSVPEENETNTAAGGAALNSSATARQDGDTSNVERPDVERFTPPPAEAPNLAPNPQATRAQPLERSTTPDGMPPSYQSGHAGTWFSGDGARTPPEVPFDEDAAYASLQNWAPSPAQSSTPPSARVETETNLPADLRKRPLPGLDMQRSAADSADNGYGGGNGYASTNLGLKRRKTEEYDFGIGGGDALEGLDAEVVGMLG